MYLLSLGNWDYVWVTLFFALNFLIAYRERRKNSGSDEFLGNTTGCEGLLGSFGSFGILEIILSGIAGSMLGFNAIYYLTAAILIYCVIYKIAGQRFSVSGVDNFTDYIQINSPQWLAILIAVVNVILLLVLSGLSVTVMFKALQSVMGFGFINNVMGLFGFTVMTILIGGRLGISYSRLFNTALVLLVFIVILVSGIIHIGGISALILRLGNLATAQNLPLTYYVAPDFEHHGLIAAWIILGYCGLKLVNLRFSLSAPGFKNAIGTLCITAILVGGGILAIATTSSAPSIPGKKIETVMAQLPDGQIGYIVKAIDATDKSQEAAPGIIPPLLDPKTSIQQKGQYNFSMANIVILRHYLPQPVLFLILLVLFSGFVLSVSDYMLNLGRITLRNFLLPLNLISKYGKIGELWSLQVSIVSYTGVTLGLSYLMFLHYDLLLFVKLTAACLIIPLAGFLCLALALPPRSNDKSQ